MDWGSAGVAETGPESSCVAFRVVRNRGLVALVSDLGDTHRLFLRSSSCDAQLGLFRLNAATAVVVVAR